ncbi:hypothetical protein SO802_011101 [Lithocarpus litseifolius]|uniref:Uncharacterized protein n=1 Tax=Lithocarpus litseifolius TaxID=425828 RepID=A0AAW2DHA9_9ROSI
MILTSDALPRKCNALVAFYQELECETSEKGLQQSGAQYSSDHQEHRDISIS